MKLIEEIKKIEEKAEKIKMDADVKGRSLVEAEAENAKKTIHSLDDKKEKLLQDKIREAKMIAEKEIDVLQQKHEQQIKLLRRSYEKYKEKALKSVQEKILEWPSSQ